MEVFCVREIAGRKQQTYTPKSTYVYKMLECAHAMIGHIEFTIEWNDASCRNTNKMKMWPSQL